MVMHHGKILCEVSPDEFQAKEKCNGAQSPQEVGLKKNDEYNTYPLDVLS